MSEESAVTFVGGKAVEQSVPQDSNLGTEEREAAKEAVREAISKAAKEAGETAAEEAKTSKAKDPYKGPGASDKPLPERGSDGKFKSTEADKAPAKDEPESDEEELDLDKASVKQLLKQRDRVANLKREAKDEVSKLRQEFQAERTRFQQEVMQFQQAQQQLAREREALKALKNDPARAVREAGWDPEKFILDLAQDGTPEGAQRRQQQELQRQIDEMKAWKNEQLRMAEEQNQRAYIEQARAHRNKAVNDYLSLGLNEEKYPHVATFYKGREKALVAEGDLIAEEFRNLTKREGSYEQILDFIEDELAERAKGWYTKNSGKQTSQVREPEPQKKVSSKGKSLSPDNSGERRTLTSKDLRDLDVDERHEAAKQAVAVALAASKNQQ